MKKLITLTLALLMAIGCAAAENGDSIITSSDGAFAITFQLPEGVKMLSGEWDAAGTLYQANLQGNDGLYFYLAVAAPLEAADEETATVTYNEENGYTDEYLKEMLTALYEDDADSFDIGVQTTAYGTKLGVIRFNDEEAPGAYIMSVWHNYEIGVTVMNVDENGNYRQVTDDQIQKIVSFLSEVWMNLAETETPAA